MMPVDGAMILKVPYVHIQSSTIQYTFIVLLQAHFQIVMIQDDINNRRQKGWENAADRLISSTSAVYLLG